MRRRLLTLAGGLDQWVLGAEQGASVREDRSEDVLVETAGVRAGVRPERSVRVRGPTLMDVEALPADIAWVVALDDLAGVRPRAEGEVAHAGDVVVVPVEGHLSVAEHLVVRHLRAGRQPGHRPRRTPVCGRGAEGVQPARREVEPLRIPGGGVT